MCAGVPEEEAYAGFLGDLFQIVGNTEVSSPATNLHSALQQRMCALPSPCAALWSEHVHPRYLHLAQVLRCAASEMERQYSQLSDAGSCASTESAGDSCCERGQ